MKYFSFAINLMALVTVLVISGCGSAKDVNGSLTVDVAKTDNTNFVDASFTIKYTNPQKSDVMNTKIDITINDNFGNSKSYPIWTNNSGSTTIGYFLPRDVSDYTFQLTAQTGDLIASKTVFVTAGTSTNTLSVNPTVLTFSSSALINDTLTATITGTGTFSVLGKNPSTNTDIGAVVTNNTLTVTKLTNATPGFVVILIVDNASPANVVSVRVNY